MSKSTVSVKNMLMLILITIIIIGLAPIVSFLSNMLNTQMCIKSQVKAVNDIESVVAEVMETGVPAIELLKVNGLCTECIWYNGTDGFQKVEIKFKTFVSPYSINVSMAWNNVNNVGGCGNSNMLPGNTYHIEVQPNQIECVDC
jgi:hypothetical protein